MLYQIKVICLSIFFLSGNLLAQELEIKKEYLSYVDDFIVFDFDGLVSHFETPAMFIGSSTGVMADPESLKNYYRNLQSNIQTGYAYSTVDELTITEISEVVYLVTASFTRYNAQDEILLKSTSYNFFKETSAGWKMFLMQSEGLP